MTEPSPPESDQNKNPDETPGRISTDTTTSTPARPQARPAEREYCMRSDDGEVALCKTGKDVTIANPDSRMEPCPGCGGVLYE